MRDDSLVRKPGPPQQFIQRRQCRWNFQRAKNPALNLRKKRARSPCVAGIQQARPIVSVPTQCVTLPTRRASRLRLVFENPTELVARRVELFIDFTGGHRREAILPAVMIEAMNPGFKPRVPNCTNRCQVAPADVGCGEQRTIEQRAYSIILDHVCATYLAQKSR